MLLPAMRFVLPAILLLLGHPSRAQVAWRDGTLPQALERARAEKKWVLVELYAGWCGPCHAMDAEVYSRADVAKEIGGAFVPLRRDGENGEGAEIHARFHVVGFPTLLVLSPDGSEVDRVMGFVAAPELLATLDGFRSGKGALATLEKRAAAQPKGGGDPVLLAELARRHALRGDERAVGDVERVVASDPEDRAGRAGDALLVLGKYYYLRGRKDFAQAKRTLERLRDVYPTAKENDEVPYNLAVALHGLGDDARAVAALDGWLAAKKDSERYNAYAWCCFKNGFGRARAVAVAREGLAAFPKADALWDTLAELLAQDGRAAEAAVAERRALEIKPGDSYYTKQMEKFGGVK